MREGDRVFTKGDYQSGVVVEYMGDFDFPKVRVLMDGQTEPVSYYEDSLLVVPEKPDLDTVLERAEYSDSYEAVILAAEIRRLRAMEERMNRLADAYAANVVMLEGKALSPDGLLGIMAGCSRSAAKLIREAIEGE